MMHMVGRDTTRLTSGVDDVQVDVIHQANEVCERSFSPDVPSTQGNLPYRPR